MTLRTHTIEKKNPQHNQEWSWEETPEFVDALLKLETATEILKNLPSVMLNKVFGMEEWLICIQ